MEKKMLLAGILVLLAVGAILYYNLTGFAINEENAKVKVGNLPVVQGLPFYVALEKGYFQEEGIDVELIKFEAPNQIIDALLQGQIDFGSTSTAAGITAVAHYKNPGKLQVYAYAGGNSTNANENLLVPLDSNITSFADLKGKKLGILGGSIQWRTITRELLAQQGLEMDKEVIIVELSPSLQVQALASKQIDALLALEPTTTIAVEQKAGKIVITAPVEKVVADPFYPGAGVVSTKFAEENPQLTRKMMKILDRTIQEINENPDAHRQYLKNYTPLTGNIFLKTPLANIKMCDDLTKQDLQSVQKFYDLFTKHKVIDGKVTPEDILYCRH